jgi:hypothetical protein
VTSACFPTDHCRWLTNETGTFDPRPPARLHHLLLLTQRQVLPDGSNP